MRYSLPAAAALALVVTFQPLMAQGDAMTLGVFVTVRAEHVPDFEAGAREHAAWHASQNDSQPWPAYQALTGHGEYAILAPDMTLASMDNPTVDMGADVAAWATQGAEFTETEEVTLWTNMPGGNPPPDMTTFPIVQVFEFEIRSGGQPAVMEGVERFSEAMADAPFHWQWSSVISADGPPSVFVAIWLEDFASMSLLGDGPAQIMADTYGPERAAMIMDAFSESVEIRSSQIWMLRPDLSYFPM